MSIFDTLFKKKRNQPGSRQYNLKMAEHLAQYHIKYVTEKRGDVDEVIGKDGGINVRDDELIVFASSDVLLRCKIDHMQVWELLSRDGVVITAPDLEHGGTVRTVIVYFVYYR